MAFDPTDDMLEQVLFSSRKVARRFRTSSQDDLYQEGLIWVYQHPKRVNDWMTDEDPKRGWRRFTRHVEWAMEKVARAEKAQRTGYHPEDEEFYAKAMVELVLPAVWDENLRVNGPSREGREPTTGGHDASEGNTWAAMVLDVERAWKKADLDTTERALVRARLEESSFAELGRMFGCAQSTAQVWYSRALRRIQTELGGAKPENGCPCGECGHPGSRKAKSNAQARHETEIEYE